MSELVRARVEERLVKLRLGTVAQRLDGILSQAARKEPTYLDFLDQILAEETEAKQGSALRWGITSAHFPAVKPGVGKSHLAIALGRACVEAGHVFGDEIIAAAVLDRVLHHSHVLLIQGDSFRLRQKKRWHIASQPTARRPQASVALSDL